MSKQCKKNWQSCINHTKSVIANSVGQRMHHTKQLV